MRPPHLRCSAFTLLELVVAMVVSALLTGMSYTALQLVLHQQRRMREKAERMASRSRLQRLLTVDLATATEVRATADGIQCSRALHVVAYVLLDSVVVRHQRGQTDTFHVAQPQLTGYFQGRVRRQGVVDAATLSGVMGHDSVSYSAQANYSAEQLMRFSR